MSSDPSDWTTERLLRHAAEFFDLPLMSVPAVMDDYDVAAHNDLLYVRGLIEELASAKVELEKELKDGYAEFGQYPVEPLMWLATLHRSAEAWIPSTLSFSEPWPEDEAAALLVAWRSPESKAA